MIGILLLVLTFLAALGAGLTAGLLFAFSAFVMDALARLPPEQGIAAMQSINVAVLNPLFVTVFFGTAALCIVLAIASFFRWGEAGAIYLVAGSLLYLVGTIGVTIALNVPLNNALAAVAPNSAEGAVLWTRYIVSWTAWNHVRTVAALTALASFIVALR
ncbi:MAG TPA: anthrone oxygenase family protein [Methylocella sp.]